MGFLVGLVLGAILGVIVDRAWTYLIERRPFVKIKTSVGQHYSDGEYLNIAITNESFEQLPPYELALFNPNCGSRQFFDHSVRTDRMPGQVDEFVVTMKFLQAQRQHLVPSLTHAVYYGVRNTSESPMPAREMTPEEMQQWCFAMIIKDSDQRIIFESNRVGVALVEIVLDAMKGTMRLHASHDQLTQASVSTNPLVRWRDRRQAQQMLARMGISSKAPKRAIIPTWLTRLLRRKLG